MMWRQQVNYAVIVDVLSNDTDLDNDNLSVTGIYNISGGTASSSPVITLSL